MPIPLGILAVAGAGGAAGAYDLLESTVLTTTAASVSFQNLNTYSAYKHLQIRGLVRDQIASDTLGTLNFRFNDDSGNNYAYHTLNGDGSSVTSTATVTQSFIRLIDANPGTTSTANVFGAFIIDILDFSNASKNTTIRSLHGAHVANEADIVLESGFWNNTSAVTKITFSTANNYLAGSRFSLYGVK